MPNYLDLFEINLDNIGNLSELFWQRINDLIILARKLWIKLNIINLASLLGHFQTPQAIKYWINIYILCFHISLLHKLSLIIFFPRKSYCWHELGFLFVMFLFRINFRRHLLKLFKLLVLLSNYIETKVFLFSFRALRVILFIFILLIWFWVAIKFQSCKNSRFLDLFLLFFLLYLFIFILFHY